MIRFVLRQKMDGYYWQCPGCGYDQEKAYVLRPTSHGLDELRETHMKAGMRAEGLVSSILGECYNCKAREERTHAD